MPGTSTDQAPTPSGQEPQGTTSPAAATNVQTGQESEERLDAAYVKQLRAEAAETRRKLRDLETANKAAEDAKLSETERANKRLTGGAARPNDARRH